MANTMHARAIISAVDRTAGPLGRIAARLRSLGARTGITAIAAQTRQIGVALGRVGREAQRSFRLIRRAALASAVAIGGSIMLTRSYARDLDDLAKKGRQIGVTVDFLQRIRYAGGIAGAEMQGLTTAIDRMVRTAGDGTLVKQIEALDPALARTLRGTKDAEEGFMAIMTRLGEIENVSKRNAIAFRAFGRGGAEAAVKLAERGSDAIKKLFEEAQKYRPSLGKRQAEEAEGFNDALWRVTQSVLGLRDAIESKLVPTLTPLINRFADWVASNRELISIGADKWIERLFRSLEGMTATLPGLISRLESLAGGINSVVQAIGGWHVALGALVVLINARLIVAIIALGKEIAALGVAMASTPIGWFVAALAGAAYLILQSWEKSGVGIRQTLDGLKSILGGFVDYVAGVFTGDFERSFSGIKAIFAGIYDVAAGVVKSIAGVIDYYFSTEIVASINRGIEQWKQLFTGFWNSIRNSAVGRFLGIADKVEDEGDDAAKKAEESGKKVSSGFATGIRSRLSDVANAAREMAGTVANHLPQSPAKVGPLRGLQAAGRKTAAQFASGVRRSLGDVRQTALALAEASMPLGTAGSARAGMRGGSAVNVYIQSPQFYLKGQGREAAEEFWREVERYRLSAMNDIGIT